MKKIPSTYYHKLKFQLVNHALWETAAWLILIVGISAVQLVDYLHWDLNLILGLMIAPFIFKVEQSVRYSWRYLWGAVLCLALYASLHMQVFFLLGVGMSVFWIVESRLGKIGMLPFIWLGLISPVLTYLVSTFSFPLRLEMSEWVAHALQWMGYSIAVEGNMFAWDDMIFSVDPACMGLNSFITGCIFTTLFIATREQQSNNKAPIFMIALLYLGTCFFAIIGNLMRIACLVLFRSMPNTVSHELIGLICLGLYVLLPMYFLIIFVFKRIKKSELSIKYKEKNILKFGANYLTTIQKHLPHIKRFISLGFVLSIAFFVIRQDHFKQAISLVTTVSADIPDMEKTVLENGITQYTSEDLLVYIKPPVRFWGASHNPQICWQASGFSFHKIREVEICETPVYIADLIKEDAHLYTAWWYDNGRIKTNQQLVWRKTMAQGGAPFKLVNLSCSTEERLRRYCESWLKED